MKDMWNTVQKATTRLLGRLDVLGISKSVAKVEATHKTLKDCMICKDDMLKRYRDDLQQAKLKYKEANNMFTQVIDHLPDMVWAKDIDGRYIMANKAFMVNFCYGMTWDELKGKTDAEIATEFKARVGDVNHTFGETCANSDVIVKDTEKARRFLELGNINGKQMKLEVHKSPVYNLEGTLYAICGVGRDITEMHDELMEAIDASDACFGREGREFLKTIANKYEFKD